MTRNRMLIQKLEREKILTKVEFVELIGTFDSEDLDFARSRARETREQIYGKDIYIRGLIELTSYCSCDCLYCGIRSGNTNAQRYRLTVEEVLECCKSGYDLGFRTFVIQGGEDPYFTDDILVDMVSRIGAAYPDCALTLSLGERPHESYKKLYDAGADRYLLRHETAIAEHYAMLHPKGQELDVRVAHLYDLKEIGYYVGTGFMVGSPFQTPECLAEDMLLLKKLEPEMVGIGPFVAHHESVFRDYPSGSVDLTLMMLAMIRLMLPEALIPATTSLGTVDGCGREKGILSGANVVMPNLSPKDVRSKYLLYDNKAFTGSEAAESLSTLKKVMEAIGYHVVIDRGDHAIRKKLDHLEEVDKMTVKDTGEQMIRGSENYVR